MWKILGVVLCGAALVIVLNAAVEGGLGGLFSVPVDDIGDDDQDPSPNTPVIQSDPTQAPANTSVITANCMLGSVMASQQGWQIENDNEQTVKSFGGTIIRLYNNANLPNGWAAEGPQRISPGTSNRTMTGETERGIVWSIYPPTGQCRQDLGVSA